MTDSIRNLRARTESHVSRWMPRHLVESAWLEHAPFAYWLVEAARPRTIVELGTHRGYSFFVFAEAVRRLELDTRISAVDSWEGDDQAGFYGNEVFDAVRAVVELEYAESSEMVRGYFADVVDHFADGSIDLFHIDGRHGYEDVREDFTIYRRKLSDRAVVLFHDTHEFAEGFGVHRFWEELAPTALSFEFYQAHGLGVLAIGSRVPRRVLEFLEAANAEPEAVRARYIEFGDEVRRAADVIQVEKRAKNFEGEIFALTAERDRLVAELDLLRSSRSWRLTAPLRRLRTGSA